MKRALASVYTVITVKTVNHKTEGKLKKITMTHSKVFCYCQNVKIIW